MEKAVPADYSCVYFTEEGQYSCVKTRKICLENFNYPSVEYAIGKTLPVVWEDGSEYMAEIQKTGTKSQMTKLAADLAKQAADQSFEEKEKRGHVPKVSTNIDDSFSNELANPKKRKRGRELSKSAQQPLRSEAEAVVMQLNHIGGEPLSEGCDANDSQNDEPKAPESEGSAPNFELVLEEKNREIERLRQELQIQKFRISRLKKIKDQGGNSSELIDIGNGLMASKCVVDDIRRQFLRALMEQTGIFTLEEIGNCSVYGKTSGRVDARPALGQKFYTLKAYVISECALLKGTLAYHKFNESCRSICTDARKRLRNIQNKSGLP